MSWGNGFPSVSIKAEGNTRIRETDKTRVLFKFLADLGRKGFLRGGDGFDQSDYVAEVLQPLAPATLFILICPNLALDHVCGIRHSHSVTKHLPLL